MVILSLLIRIKKIEKMISLNLNKVKKREIIIKIVHNNEKFIMNNNKYYHS